MCLAAWDPYTARDSHQLDKVQRRAARFAKRYHMADHISLRTYLSVPMAVIRRTHEKCSSVRSTSL